MIMHRRWVKKWTSGHILKTYWTAEREGWFLFGIVPLYIRTNSVEWKS